MEYKEHLIFLLLYTFICFASLVVKYGTLPSVFMEKEWRGHREGSHAMGQLKVFPIEGIIQMTGSWIISTDRADKREYFWGGKIVGFWTHKVMTVTLSIDLVVEGLKDRHGK